VQNRSAKNETSEGKIRPALRAEGKILNLGAEAALNPEVSAIPPSLSDDFAREMKEEFSSVNASQNERSRRRIRRSLNFFCNRRPALAEYLP
jgi:hypothetical protein